MMPVAANHWLGRFFERASKRWSMACLRKDRIAEIIYSDPHPLRDMDEHDAWAEWECDAGNRRVMPIA
jgi:hypothetical protein